MNNINKIHSNSANTLNLTEPAAGEHDNKVGNGGDAVNKIDEAKKKQQDTKEILKSYREKAICIVSIHKFINWLQAHSFFLMIFFSLKLIVTDISAVSAVSTNSYTRLLFAGQSLQDIVSLHICPPQHCLLADIQ